MTKTARHKRPRAERSSSPPARRGPSQDSGQGRGLRRALWPIGLVVLLVAPVVVWALARDSGSAAHDFPGGDPGVSHVHGLGIDPGDGTLYAATHFGMFRVPESGSASRVADRFQDTMGFTVVGPRHFLGSGHPDPQDPVLHKPGVRPLLGLIESTDAGATWQPISLFGEADFHGLAAIHDRIYGYDSTGGRFMVSTDKKTWTTLSTVEMASFAVSPTDPQMVVATTSDGVVRSRDGGRTWNPPESPALLVVSWDRRGDLWGATTQGASFVSRDAGATWSPRATLPGPPDALLATDGVLYAASERAIYHSADGAKTWTLRYRDPSQ